MANAPYCDRAGFFNQKAGHPGCDPARYRHHIYIAQVRFPEFIRWYGVVDKTSLGGPLASDSGGRGNHNLYQITQGTYLVSPLQAQCPGEFIRGGGRFDDGFVYYSTVFNGADNVFLEPVFRGGSIENVFGGVTLDLRKTTLQEGISHLSISSVFGGTTLLIPAGWNVEIQSDSVFGGFKDKRPFTDNIEKGAKLIIKAECVFGGGEIR